MDITWYSFFVGAGVILAIGNFIWRFRQKNMPDLIFLLILILIAIPICFVGARLWTYLFDVNLWNMINQNPQTTDKIKVFFGLDGQGVAGLSIHGVLISGFFYFLLVFTWYSQKYHISLWFCFDILIQSVLICQIIGRWGNFFNQELLGEIISENYPQEFALIPQWFGNKLHFKSESAKIIRQPLFLYESFANFLTLLIVILILPKIGIFFSPNLWNKLKKASQEEEKNKNWWNTIKHKIKRGKIINKAWNNNIVSPHIKERSLPSIRISSGKWKKWQLLPHPKGVLYNTELRKIKNMKKIKIWKRISLFCQRDSSELTNTFNPWQLKITRVGVAFFYYLFSYGLIRLILQTFRYQAAESNHPMPITYVVSIIFIFLGFLGILYWQWFAPYKWRSKDWFYETWYSLN